MTYDGLLPKVPDNAGFLCDIEGEKSIEVENNELHVWYSLVTVDVAYSSALLQRCLHGMVG